MLIRSFRNELAMKLIFRRFYHKSSWRSEIQTIRIGLTIDAARTAACSIFRDNNASGSLFSRYVLYAKIVGKGKTGTRTTTPCCQKTTGQKENIETWFIWVEDMFVHNDTRYQTFSVSRLETTISARRYEWGGRWWNRRNASSILNEQTHTHTHQAWKHTRNIHFILPGISNPANHFQFVHLFVHPFIRQSATEGKKPGMCV